MGYEVGVIDRREWVQVVLGLERRDRGGKAGRWFVGFGLDGGGGVVVMVVFEGCWVELKRRGDDFMGVGNLVIGLEGWRVSYEGGDKHA